MLLEGTALYFLLIFLIIVLTYIIKKVSLIFIFEKARIKGINALIPFKYRIDLTDSINLNRSVAYMAYIPVYGIKYRKIIIETLLQGLGLNKKDYIYFIMFPMYKYPELAFRNVKLIQNNYSLTETFLESEKILSKKDNEQSSKIENNQTNNNSLLNNINYEQELVSVDNNQKDIYPEDSIFTKQQSNNNYNKKAYQEDNEVVSSNQANNEKICPNCGAKLSHDSTICFLCGKKV